MQITEEILRGLTSDVCTSMLGLQIQPLPAPPRPAEAYLIGTIRILGDTCAGLEVIATADLAKHIASVMFDTPATDLANDEVFDAIGEVANIIGGGVKGLAEGETQLSLPCVDMLTSHDYDFDRTNCCVDVHFECVGEGLLVRYIDRLATSAETK